MGMFNNYIKEDKLELTNVNSRIDNVEEQQLSLSYIIDNLEIGGRNLLTGTQSGKDWGGYTSFENGEFYIDNPTGKSDVILSGPKNMILEPGKYTISFEFKTTGFTSYNSGNNGVQIWILDNDYDPAFNLVLRYNELSINEYKKYSYTFITNTKYDKAYIRIDNDGNVNNTGHTELWVKNIKLERGNKATDWTPAIEDIQNGYTWDSEKNSFAVGKDINTASGNYSFAEGESTTAQGSSSHAEGFSTTSIGEASHAEGGGATATGNYSHAEGYYSVTGGTAIENDLTAGTSTESGSYAHAEGNATLATGASSHTEGKKTFASGIASHAEGHNTNAAGQYSHAEGESTTTIGPISHTEGYNSKTGADVTINNLTPGSISTPGSYAHAEGNATIAKGISSHTEGKKTFASGAASHAEGNYTITYNEAEHAEGMYNKSNTGSNEKDKTISSIGIGTVENDRKNAFEVMNNGDVYINGVGGYDGTNAVDANSSGTLGHSIQEYLIENQLPQVEDKLIYFKDNEGFISNQLLSQDDVILVNTQDDYDLCTKTEGIETDVLGAWQQFQCNTNSSNENTNNGAFNKTISPEYGKGVLGNTDKLEHPASGYGWWYSDGANIKNDINSGDFNGYIIPFSKNRYSFDTLFGCYSSVTTSGDQIGFSIVNDKNALPRRVETTDGIYYRNTLYDKVTTDDNGFKHPSESAWVKEDKTNNTAKVIFTTSPTTKGTAESFPTIGDDFTVYDIENIQTSSGRKDPIESTTTVKITSNHEATGYLGFLTVVVTNSSGMELTQGDGTGSTSNNTGTIYVFGSVFDIKTKQWNSTKIIDGSNSLSSTSSNYWKLGKNLVAYNSTYDGNVAGKTCIIRCNASYNNGKLEILFGDPVAYTNKDNATFNGSKLSFDFTKKTYSFEPYHTNGSPINDIKNNISLSNFTPTVNIDETTTKQLSNDEFWNLFTGDTKFMYNAYSYEYLYIEVLNVLIDNKVIWVHEDGTNTEYGLNSSRDDYENKGNVSTKDILSGSRLAYNSITKKLFYSNGDIIYQIAENKDNIEVDLSDYYTKNDVDEIINNIQDQGVEYTSGSNISIDENNKISALGYTYDVQKKSFAEGNATVANGIGSHSEGEKTFASSIASHAEGFETIASGVASHSEGAKYENNRSTESAGLASHAEGASTYAKADGSHTEGILNTAGRFLGEISAAAQELGISGTPEELAAKLLGYGAHAEGMNNEALGSCSHAEGNTTKALANSTHAEGDTTIAFGEASHAEGCNTQAKGNQSHAEGSNTVAIGNSSHTEGTSTTASGSFSHAEGSHTEASGRDSHAEGAYNKAIGIASHAEGEHTIAKNHYEHAEGKFNISNHNPDDDYPAYNTISSIGIGTDEDNRKNAFEVMQNGDIYIIGVGDYDGTNFENSLTLQETIKNTINVVRVKELFEDVTPEEEITAQEIYDLYHYSDTSNGGKFYKIVNNKYVETNENIKPNIYYKWVDTLSADKKQETIDNGDGTTTIKDAFVLDLTFDTPQNQNILNEYMIEFISGSKIPGIQIKNVNSEKIYWNSKPSLLQNALHQIHIVNNLGVIVIGV